MRIYIRNKQKYDPATPERELISVEVNDFARTTIADLKEHCKSVSHAKVDILYYQDNPLADDRSVGHYNIQNGSILETTSNPFWVACIYTKLREVEQQRDQQLTDKRTQQWTHKSIIRKYTLIQVLFNSNKDQGDVQPPHFPTVDAFLQFIQDLGKKGAAISPYTEADLRRLLNEYQYMDMGEIDPVGAFIRRQAIRLGFKVQKKGGIGRGNQLGSGRGNQLGSGRGNQLGSGSGIQLGSGRGNQLGSGRGNQLASGSGIQLGSGRGNQLASGRGIQLGSGRGNQTGSGRGNQLGSGSNNAAAVGGTNKRDAANLPTPKQNRNRGKKQERPCEHCEEASAVEYCPECDGGTALCGVCSDVLHRGAARRNHQRQDIDQAPRPAKAYIPHAYRSPFALLLGLFSCLHETPPILSLTEDELKARSQQVTDTDLSDKTPGKYMSGFDSIENLQTKGLVYKEAAANPTYQLTEAGKNLARKLSKFHNAVLRFLIQANVPKMPDLSSCSFNGHQVVLLMDSQEKQQDRLVALARQHQIPVQVRELKCGDYIWIVVPEWACDGLKYIEVLPDQEKVLPHIVERKTWDDLLNSTQTTRFRNQVESMKRSGLRDKFYLIEGAMHGMRSKPSIYQQQDLQVKLSSLLMEEGFLVNYTSTWLKTAQWLFWLTNMVTALYQSGTASTDQLMTFAEYSRKVGGTKKKTELYREKAMRGPRHCHVWQAEHFIDLILRDSEGIPLLDLASVEFNITNRAPNNTHLLIKQGLENYNKGRQKHLNRCLEEVCKQVNNTATDIVSTTLGPVRRDLVHYDVPSYWQLKLQVFLGIALLRTESDEDTDAARSKFLQDIQGDHFDGNYDHGLYGDGNYGDGLYGDGLYGDLELQRHGTGHNRQRGRSHSNLDVVFSSSKNRRSGKPRPTATVTRADLVTKKVDVNETETVTKGDNVYGLDRSGDNHIPDDIVNSTWLDVTPSSDDRRSGKPKPTATVTRTEIATVNQTKTLKNNAVNYSIANASFLGTNHIPSSTKLYTGNNAVHGVDSEGGDGFLFGDSSYKTTTTTSGSSAVLSDGASQLDYASNSQEEQFMLDQALEASMAIRLDSLTSDNSVSHHSLKLDEEEDPELKKAIELSKKTALTDPIGQIHPTGNQESLFIDEDVQSTLKADEEEDNLKRALELSMKAEESASRFQAENGNTQEEEPAGHSEMEEDKEFQKALELSKQCVIFGSSTKSQSYVDQTISKSASNSNPFVPAEDKEDKDLRKAIELSKKSVLSDHNANIHSLQSTRASLEDQIQYNRDEVQTCHNRADGIVQGTIKNDTDVTEEIGASVFPGAHYNEDGSSPGGAILPNSITDNNRKLPLGALYNVRYGQEKYGPEIIPDIHSDEEDEDMKKALQLSLQEVQDTSLQGAPSANISQSVKVLQEDEALARRLFEEEARKAGHSDILLATMPPGVENSQTDEALARRLSMEGNKTMEHFAFSDNMIVSGFKATEDQVLARILLEEENRRLEVLNKEQVRQDEELARQLQNGQDDVSLSNFVSDKHSPSKTRTPKDCENAAALDRHFHNEFNIPERAGGQRSMGSSALRGQSSGGPPGGARGQRSMNTPLKSCRSLFKEIKNERRNSELQIEAYRQRHRQNHIRESGSTALPSGGESKPTLTPGHSSHSTPTARVSSRVSPIMATGIGGSVKEEVIDVSDDEDGLPDLLNPKPCKDSPGPSCEDRQPSSMSSQGVSSSPGVT
ncbi:uncharacterized protein LOC106176633 [Lingula anatina]|uniref:Crossover junction endonuclease MUS81 n=1 Tax=Lingula anatina TaxID=7574 RepID=A0A1S3JVY5_LINAN|nr:uncharacterized protein LOC106176633 [Lingula anatina]|eukprot:XP_013414553.1 uncharacterized protein LOC106176633 [Lingula anatina]